MASLVSSCSFADEMSKSESLVGSTVLFVRFNFLYRTGRSSPPGRATSAKGLDHQRLRLGQVALGLPAASGSGVLAAFYVTGAQATGLCEKALQAEPVPLENVCGSEVLTNGARMVSQ